MVTDKLKELEVARAKLATLEQSIAEELNRELAALPARYGFASTNEFVSALNAAAGGSSAGTGTGRGRRPGRPPASAASAAKPTPAKKGARKRRTRAVITDETRAQVKKLVDSGKTGAEIAQTLKISVPSVQNIKKALGLVKER
jgi:hypothetical protein